MKKLLLAPALAVLLLSSCSDDPELEAPQISSIEFSKEKIAEGQLIIITSDVTDGDTDTANLTYEWKATDGFSSDEKEAKWVPSETGEQVITLTVRDGDTETTKEERVEVLEPDFRLGLWGDSEEDIILSEENAGNEANVPSEGILVYPGDEEIAVDAYILEDDALIQAFTLFFPEYPEAEYGRFITDYEARKDDLTDTYGEPEEITEWATSEAEATYANTPERWPQAIAAGDLLIASLWQVSETTAMALTLQGDGEGGILYGLIYFPLDEGGRYTSDFLTGQVTGKLLQYSDKIKNKR